MSIQRSLIMAVEDLICVMKNNEKSLKKILKQTLKNKMIKIVSTINKSSKNARVSVTGYHCFMRSKKMESESQVIEKISM